jgi:hypothetical protein
MDEIVRQAMTKWPSVPHCYGWLALDARGAFRMRDEAAQATHAAGDVIRHPALLAFIYRNYLHDERGCWYFQNGPQRVYVELETTPFIARTDPLHGFVTHDGEPLTGLEQAWMTEEGRLVLRAGEKIAMVDDRDLGECLAMLRVEGRLVEDIVLMDWLHAPNGELQLATAKALLPVQPLKSAHLQQLGFVAHPVQLPDSLAGVH